MSMNEMKLPLTILHFITIVAREETGRRGRDRGTVPRHTYFHRSRRLFVLITTRFGIGQFVYMAVSVSVVLFGSCGTFAAAFVVVDVVDHLL
mmetsp:Transcript_8956/g.9562  ORF Transcript_8956/g.9562 Transcript_8956/m.9562 type:complete len:92 (-) Transcript_8956:69-344(-)